MTDYLFEPTAPATIPIIGSDKLYPVFLFFCVGRNYEAHAAEMGAVVDREAPFYFTKSPTTLVMAEGEIAMRPHGKLSLRDGTGVCAEERRHEYRRGDALSHIYGCAAGLDMTRRDLQNKAKENRKPWDTAKDVDESAVITPLRQMSEVPSVASGRIYLSQNGTVKQDADLSELVWSVPEIIADLSTMYTLQQGDVIYMGTPAGVGAVSRGDVLTGGVEGIGDFEVKIA